jgi:hypothetical protein
MKQASRMGAGFRSSVVQYEEAVLLHPPAEDGSG